jgi:hypothetical protein
MISDKIRQVENLHILLWLLKDTCWVLIWKTGGMIMIVPTLFVAFYITFLSRKNIPELLHNIAVTCWIIANSIWMIGEFYFDDETRTFASIFFILGLAVILFYYLYYLPFVANRKVSHK